MACGCNVNYGEEVVEGCCEETKTITYLMDIDDTMVVQKVLYERDGLLALVTQFSSDSPFKPDTERFTEILEEYIKITVKYNLTFQTLMTNYITPEHRELISGKQYEIKVDFLTNRLIIEYK